MAHIQYVDELIREYLLYRGFSTTLKAFDSELKVDKDKGFRVDKIVDQLMQFVYNYDLNALRDLWNHLDSRMFSKLEHHLASGVKKLENSILKLFVINAIVNNKPEKVTDFFSKMTTELQNQPEWKDWFILPFIKSPEENPVFAVYFTKQWQDTLLVSLHNFLATVFQCMPQPTLSNFEEDFTKLKRLQDENETLKARLSQLLDQHRVNAANEVPFDVPPPSHLLDDFYVIAQENPGESQVKSFKNLIRNIGTASSPVMHRKDIGTKKKLSKSWKPN